MTWWDPAVAVAGLVVGIVVGLTGMGGGALMTPILVFVFGVPPLAAVSSDVVASFFMKPIGGIVHLRHGTVHLKIVGWLCVGSVPGAFCGVLLLRLLGRGQLVQSVLLVALGVVLLLAACALTAKAYLRLRERTRTDKSPSAAAPLEGVRVRPRATVAIGLFGGLVVGLTSVGAGSIMIVCLLMLYPTIRTGQLVGTDLLQAVPLVASASLGHILFGDFVIGLTGSILVGAIPGVWIGARVSSRSPGGLVRRALALVMLASGTKLLGASAAVVAAVTVSGLVLGVPAWGLLRFRHGETPLAWQERRRIQRAQPPDYRQPARRPNAR